MVADIPADVAYIGGVWCEGVLYGLHLVIFGAVCSIFLGNSHRMGQKSTSKMLVVYTFCMFTLSTAHVAFAVQALYQGFILQKAEPTDVFFRQNVFPNRKAIYIINTLLGDALLIWRAYMIWQMNWMICSFPILFLLGTAICGIKTIVANAMSAGSSVFDPSILSWITATFVLNMASQISATLLIAYRIYRALDFTDRKHVRARYMSLVWLVVESGAAYTAAAIVQLVTTLLDMNAGVILEFMLAQFCAIAPGLIIIRIALGFSYDTATSTGGAGDGKGTHYSPDVALSTFRATTHHTNTSHTHTHTQGEKSLFGTLDSENTLAGKYKDKVDKDTDSPVHATQTHPNRRSSHGHGAYAV